jgi:hypothetical protein
VPTVPTISVPLPTSTPTSTSPTTSTSSTSPAPAPGSSGTTTETSEAASTPFSYSVSRLSARRSGAARRITVTVSLSHTATLVAILQRRQVPALVNVRAARAGASTFAIGIPARVRAGRYVFQLVFGRGEEQHRFTRTVSVPK